MRLNPDSKTTNWLKTGTSFQLANIKENLNTAGSNVISTALSQTPDIPVNNSDGVGEVLIIQVLETVRRILFVSPGGKIPIREVKRTIWQLLIIKPTKNQSALTFDTLIRNN